VKQLESAGLRPVRTTLPSTSIVGLRQRCSLQNPLGLGLDSLPGRVTTLRHNRSTNPLRLERPQGRRQRLIGDRFDRTAALVRTSRVA